MYRSWQCMSTKHNIDLRNLLHQYIAGRKHIEYKDG